MGGKTEKDSPGTRFFNRELSWLAFNDRVLLESKNRRNPLLERLRFIEIATSNLDEFFMVRVAGLKGLKNIGIKTPDISGLSPETQLEEIYTRAKALLTTRDKILKGSLLPQLKKQGLVIKTLKDLSETDKFYVSQFLQEKIFPKLKPVTIDPKKPFPRVVGKVLYFVISLGEVGQDQGQKLMLVPISPRMPKLIPLVEAPQSFALTEAAVRHYLSSMFPDAYVQGIYPCRFTQDANFQIVIDSEGWPPRQMGLALGKRAKGPVIRLEVAPGMDEQILTMIKGKLNLDDRDVYWIQGPLDIGFVQKVYGLKGWQHLKYPKNLPRINYHHRNLFQLIREKDHLLHHPYDSFRLVLALLQQGARDPQVTEIFQSLYRVSHRSPMIKALKEAASQGKQVTVMLELKARFDEAANVRWAKDLEQAGCRVLYSPWHLKAHCKMLQIFRWEQGEIRGYTHLGTGNYNEETAKAYTDMSLITADEAFAQEGRQLLKMLTGQQPWKPMKQWAVAPQDLRSTFLNLIKREQNHCSEGKPGLIMAKMNSLVDQEIIEALYQASQAGVKIKLLVRGSCCLVPGVAGMSEHIGVRSIVGRFLEHSRVFYFLNNHQEEVYLSSADWMPRNLDHRIELLFPLVDKSLKTVAKEMLEIEWQDNVQSWELNAQGSYSKDEIQGKKRVNAQSIFMVKKRDLRG